ncbi:MAG: hypothetical protein R3D29_08800 [Nitratireductor sp.]
MLETAKPAASNRNPPVSSNDMPGWLVRFRAWRATVVQNPRFRSLASRMPLLRSIANRRAEALFSITSGFVQSQVLYACLDAGLLDLLSRGPQREDKAAAQLDIPSGNFAHLVQSANAIGILHRSGDGWLTLADAGAVVASDPGLAAMIRHHAAFYRDLTDPTALLRGEAGETAMSRLWSYAGAERDPSVPGRHRNIRQSCRQARKCWQTRSLTLSILAGFAVCSMSVVARVSLPVLQRDGTRICGSESSTFPCRGSRKGTLFQRAAGRTHRMPRGQLLFRSASPGL